MKVELAELNTEDGHGHCQANASEHGDVMTDVLYGPCAQVAVCEVRAEAEDAPQEADEWFYVVGRMCLAHGRDVACGLLGQGTEE